MKKVIAFILILILIAVGAGYGYYEYLKKKIISTYPTSEKLSEFLELGFTTPSDIPRYEVILLPNDKPLFISLNLNNSIAEENNLKIKHEKITWKCSHGELGKEQGAGSNEWFPKEKQSVTASITATFEGVYYTDLGLKFVGEINVKKEISIKVISPVSSRFLDEKGFIDGYEIGTYLNPYDLADLRKYSTKSNNPRNHPDKYSKPAYFYKVTEKNKNLYISPHFKFGEYALDYEWYSKGIPQYIALDFNLIRKLEDLISLMNSDGYEIDHFTIIYPFRSPAYNRGAIDDDGTDKTLKEVWSLHQYGKAFDFILDQDGDLVIDDLNNDGIIDMRDPAVIMHYVNILDRQYREEANYHMIGGAGLYPHHDFWERKQSPYIHFDVRGFLNGDGTLIRWPGKWEDGTYIKWGKM